jgi:hypothetical protein
MTDEDLNDEWAAEAAEEEADRARKKEPPPPIGNEEFLAWRSPRLVTEGPNRLDNPLWHWLVRTRHSGYSANEVMHGPSSFAAGPAWCFERFGKSETTLPDGRVVHIAGEHEDYYDPDFYIYNDVIVIDRNGSIAITGYPGEVFPPTDFHSATRVSGAIFIIGCLGYPEQRVEGVTPVLRLDLDKMIIAPVATTGEAPGWIHRHSTELADDGVTIVVRGGELWRGDLALAPDVRCPARLRTGSPGHFRSLARQENSVAHDRFQSRADEGLRLQYLETGRWGAILLIL